METGVQCDESQYSLTRTILSNFELGNVPFPTLNGFIYLGLPIGDDKFTENFYYEKNVKNLYFLYDS